MASTIVSPLAATLQAMLEDLDVTPTLKGYRWDPGLLDQVPAAVVGLPTIDRTEADGAESQLGSYDWLLRFPVVFYFDLPGDGSAAVATQEQAAATVEAWIRAVDAIPDLGDPTVADAKVISAGPPEPVEEAPRALLEFPTVLELLKFVTPA